VAPAEKVVVIPLGFELGPFQAPAGERQQLRREVRARYGIPDGSPLVTLIARLVPIKRVDRFLRIAERLSGQLPAIRFLIVGDGELTNELMGSSEARRLRDRLAWAGYQKDIPAVCFASDVVALTSDNEGTPVSLIEAHAAGLPAASTDVGGVRQVVEAGVTGYIVPKNDEHSLAEAIASLISDPTRAAEMGARGRERVLERFTMDRLIADVDALYRELLSSRRSPIADTATVEVRR
jgi:glycosyltransferase involved in cell wall biosynthesis